MAKKRKLSDDPMVQACRKHGFRTVARTIGYVGAWCVAAESLGHAPSFDEYREWWAASERTAFRDQAAFRKVTGLDDPSEVWERARNAGVVADREAGTSGGYALLPYMHWNLS
jgi:hypothetical protein